MFMKLPDGFGNLAVLSVPVAIYEEEVFPCLALARTTFDLRHVELVAAEGSERVVERADFVRDAEHEAGAIMAGRGRALASEHEEPGDVGGAVLDVGLENGEVVFLGGQGAGNGRGVLFLRGEFSGAGVGGGLDDFGVREVAMEPDAALGVGLRVDVELFDLVASPAAEQALLDG